MYKVTSYLASCFSLRLALRNRRISGTPLPSCILRLFGGAVEQGKRLGR